VALTDSIGDRAVQTSEVSKTSEVLGQEGDRSTFLLETPSSEGTILIIGQIALDLAFIGYIWVDVKWQHSLNC